MRTWEHTVILRGVYSVVQYRIQYKTLLHAKSNNVSRVILRENPGLSTEGALPPILRRLVYNRDDVARTKRQFIIRFSIKRKAGRHLHFLHGSGFGPFNRIPNDRRSTAFGGHRGSSESRSPTPLPKARCASSCTTLPQAIIIIIIIMIACVCRFRFWLCEHAAAEHRRCRWRGHASSAALGLLRAGFFGASATEHGSAIHHGRSVACRLRLCRPFCFRDGHASFKCWGSDATKFL
jgi:hypothetical protein